MARVCASTAIGPVRWWLAGLIVATCALPAQRAPAQPAQGSPAPRSSDATAGVPATAAAAPVAGGPAAATASAADLIKRRLYKDAIKVLLKESAGLPPAESARQYLMLGECYYMLEMYAEARPYFAQARNHLPNEQDKTIAEFRLACVAYRLGDADGAIEKTDAFAKAHPGDARVHTLLLFKMKVVVNRGGPDAQAELESLHKAIAADAGKSSYATVVAAERILTDFYVKIGNADKAKARYVSTVNNARNAIAQHIKEGTAVPASLEQAHDNAAMQLGTMFINEGNTAEAVRWLENIRYDADLKKRAALYLAEIAYQSGDFDKAMGQLSGLGLTEGAGGAVKSDVYLLLGMCEKGRKGGNVEKASEYLEKVEPGTQGYFQAQSALGDIYREKGFNERAVRCYGNVIETAAYAPNALYSLAKIYISQAGDMTDKAKQDALYGKAADMLSQLGTRYSLSRQAKAAQEEVEALLKKGYDVTSALSDDEKVKGWEKTVAQKPGSVEAVQSLLSIIRLHAKSIAEEKTGKLLKAPNYAACSAECDRLLDAKVYSGKGLAEDSWKAIRCEALFYRGQGELASASGAVSATQPANAPPTTMPVLIRSATIERAIAFLEAAKALADPKQLELVKGIELTLLEAQFKSDKAEIREKAQKRFAELVNEYGTDSRFQKLALDLAGWYQQQGRLAEAAREYRGIAERGKNLPREETLKALYLAGGLYSSAATEARNKHADARYAIYIHAPEVIKLGDLLKTYKPLQNTVKLKLPRGGAKVAAKEALTELSKACGIPFVWSPAGKESPNSVGVYLASTTVNLDESSGTVESFLRKILDLKNHRLEFDIGIAGGTPTIPLPTSRPEEPDQEDLPRIIEIYDVRLADKRFAPLNTPYGSWQDVHGNAPAILYHIIQRIENTTGVKVTWAEGLDKRDLLASEFKSIPATPVSTSCSCSAALARVLEKLQLQYRIIRRDISSEFYDQAKECFNEIRKIDPRSKYGERSLFILALNFQQQGDVERMKIVLKEYLKTFDNPSNEHYHEACFWVGWAFENERKFREACHYYSKAAEERLVVYKPAPGEKFSRDALRAQMAHDTLLALEEPVGGQFKNASLEQEFADFVRLNTNVELRVEGGAEGSINRDRFKGVSCFDVICETLEQLGLSAKVENAGKVIADKAYYRLALAYKKDGRMEQALDACTALLSRYPHTPRLREAYRLKLDIYKGLKDYRNVLATLEELKAKCGDQIEAYQQDYEIAWIYFDLCRYDKAVEYFLKSLTGAEEGQDKVNIRDGLARALFRHNQPKDALDQYQALLKEEGEAVRLFVDQLMVAYLKFELGQSSAVVLPEPADKFIVQYEALSDAQRQQLPRNELAKATWVYYVLGLADLKRGRTGPAIEKLSAAGNSPDDSLASDSLYRVAMLHLKDTQFKKARELFEFLLFTTQSTESQVRGTYGLALCHQGLGENENAVRRFTQLLERYPDSAYAELVVKNPLYAQIPATAKATTSAPTTTTTGTTR